MNIFEYMNKIGLVIWDILLLPLANQKAGEIMSALLLKELVVVLANHVFHWKYFDKTYRLNRLRN